MESMRAKVSRQYERGKKGTALLPMAFWSSVSVRKSTASCGSITHRKCSASVSEDDPTTSMIIYNDDLVLSYFHDSINQNPK